MAAGSPRPAPSRRTREVRIPGEGELGHDLAPNEMLLNDPLQDFRGARMIPDAFGIHDGDGSAGADAQAICLRAIDQRFRFNQSQFLQSPLQVIPRRQALLLLAAFGFGLVGAQEDVTPVFLQAQAVGLALRAAY